MTGRLRNSCLTVAKSLGAEDESKGQKRKTNSHTFSFRAFDPPVPGSVRIPAGSQMSRFYLR